MSYSLSNHSTRHFVRGDKNAFSRIFKDIYPSMLRYAQKFLRNENESEDTVQEAFVELWNNRERFEGYEQIRAFLYLTIKNKCLNQIKHLSVVEKYAAEKKSAAAPDFDDETIRTEMIYQLRAAIKTLPEQRKKIILLSLKGMKNPEIADFLEISVNTVKLQKKIAYKTLKENLGQQSAFSILFFLFSN